MMTIVCQNDGSLSSGWPSTKGVRPDQVNRFVLPAGGVNDQNINRVAVGNTRQHQVTKCMLILVRLPHPLPPCFPLSQRVSFTEQSAPTISLNFMKPLLSVMLRLPRHSLLLKLWPEI